MNPASFPVVKLELSGMKHAIMSGFLSHMDEMQTLVQQEVDKICTPENLRHEISKVAKEVITHAITTQVRDFYSFGEGRAAVAEAVADALDLNKKDRREF